MKLYYPEGATPVDPNEMEGLIPNISLQSELNELEEENIMWGRKWALSTRNRKLRTDLMLSEHLKLLHQKMFENVWKWAGSFRTAEKSIGIEPYKIPVELLKLCEDVKAQLEFKSYSLDELVVRFHHRLVKIHPFANGNGRHARLASDILIRSKGGEEFTWGNENLNSPGAARVSYISALRQADIGNLKPLLMFARN